MALISIDEVKELASKHIPKVAQAHPGIKMLLKFVGKTVRAVNNLDDRLKKVEAALDLTNSGSSEEGTDA